MNFPDIEFGKLMFWLLDRAAEAPDESGADESGGDDRPSDPRRLVIPSLSQNAERN